jgi:hypothetical protein
MATAVLPFRFDPIEHAYLDLETGEVFPHITGMLEDFGLIDDTWYTEESSHRGTQVHTLTASYDLGAIENPNQVDSAYKAYLLAHVRAMQILRPTILAVEEPAVHPYFRFGGRPDRRVIVNRAKGILEVKTTAKAEQSHAIQTALQAILVADTFDLPPESLVRFCLYLRKDGKFKLEEHRAMHDFVVARRVIRQCCNR